MDLLPIIQQFANQISKGKIEIYNEASIQYELSIFLRQNLSDNYKVQLERNISYFDLSNNDIDPFKKKEMDIVVFDANQKEKHCIELKFPTNGQYPEQMFSSCKDVKFLEQLCSAGFSDCYFIMFANDSIFYCNKGGPEIYLNFRKNKLIKGTIQKPTGAKDEVLSFSGGYAINWERVLGELKYFIIVVPQRINNTIVSRRIENEF